MKIPNARKYFIDGGLPADEVQQTDVDNMESSIDPENDSWTIEMIEYHGSLDAAIRVYVAIYLDERPEGGYESPEYKATETWRKED